MSGGNSSKVARAIWKERIPYPWCWGHLSQGMLWWEPKQIKARTPATILPPKNL